MNRLAMLLSFFVLFSFNDLHAQPMTRDYLRRVISYADNQKSMQDARNLALQNPNLLEEIVFISKTEMDNSTGRSNAFGYLLECSIIGTISKVHFFDIAFTLLRDIDKYAFPDQIEGELALYRSQIGHYGYDAISKTSHVPLLDNLDSLIISLKKMRSSNLIGNDGILNSLVKKIENTKEMLTKEKQNGKNPAINLFSAMLNEIEAQKGKHLTTDAYYIIKTYAENIMNQIRNSAL